MENFIVSARKYRPATFDMVIGQEAITSTLKNAIRNNQLAQAFLFCGPRGVGKTTCARILAKTINCFNPVDQIEPCNRCESCLSFNRSASFNIHELDAASNNSVDDIRNLVDQVRIPPQVGRYKVYIIDEVHMLSQQAFNAFLKTLEEPPSYAKFILATTEKHKIIPTILSRCQIFDFKRITVKDIADYLSFVAGKEGVEAEEEALHVIAQKADGALRDALSFFDQLVSFAGKELTYDTVIAQLNILDYTYYFRIFDEILAQDHPMVLLTVNEVIERGFDGQHFIIGLGEHLRNLLVSKDPATISLTEASPAVREKYLEQSGRCETRFLLQALGIHNQCDINYRNSNNKRLLLELALLQMCAAAGVQPVTEAGPAAAATPSAEKKAAPPPASPIKPALQSRTPQRQDAAPGQARSISIKPEKNIQPEKPTGPPDLPDQYDHKDFTQEQLDKVWAYFIESIAPQYPNFYNSLVNQKPRLMEQHIIRLELGNKMQEMAILEKKQELLDFLREELKNYKIGLELIVAESGSSAKPFTAEEKFRAMAEKNPVIKDLKEKLDLELEL
jgi:DNA polymerase-3 subunit gamma/tau